MAIDPQFEKVVGYMVSAQAKIATGTFGSSQRPWLNFDDVQEAGKFDSAALHDIFDRSVANDDYVKGAASASTPGINMQTAKLSADFLAGLERDHRMRTRSRVRMMIHGGNRASANGLTFGPLSRNTDWLSRKMTATAKK